MAKTQNVLLVLLPFWTPLIPPMGIACLKSYLQGHGYGVRGNDANVERRFREIYDNYLAALRQAVPPEKRGNFDNIAVDVLQNHMNAFVHRERKEERFDLLKLVAAKNFFIMIPPEAVQRLDDLVVTFFQRLEDYVLELMEGEQPDVFGVSVYKGAFAASLFACRLVKERFPNVKTVWGGGIFSDQLAIGSPNFDYFLERSHSYLDHVIVGEGEVLLLKLLEGELTERLLTREHLDGEYLDFKSVGVPDFSDFQILHYPQIAAYSSRSCPFQCGFCAETVNWGKYRKKETAQVAGELQTLYRAHGRQLFLLTDSLLNPVIEPLSEALQDAEDCVYFDGYLRAAPQVADTANTFQWRRGGFYRARLGIESGSPRVLELMDKRLTPELIEESLSSLAGAGIKTSTYWVVGYPGETEEDFLQTLALIEEMKDDIYEAECNPFRFYLTGQVKSDQWLAASDSQLLYPEKFRELLVLQTWYLADSSPGREEIYRRMARFVEHCRQLGIPNPYSWQEIHRADQRWQKLHPMAVPPLVSFQEAGTIVDECRNLEQLQLCLPAFQDNDDFEF
jgi:hypothetical protein